MYRKFFFFICTAIWQFVFLAPAFAASPLETAQAMPLLNIEGRCIWLDRGTIAAARNRAGMAHLFDCLQSDGFNTVYFEANNNSEAMWKSELEPRNPLVSDDFDPLAVAVEEAHKRSMELHAWLWTFRVAQTVPAGPTPLSQHAQDWSLKSASGSSLTPVEQERWLSPANPDVRKWEIALMQEIAKNYAVDGIQMDYIRYPFQKPGNEMGRDTRAQKTEQVNEFVKEVSQSVRAINRRLKISAAVFPFARAQRLFIIQQDWETWVNNGWVDILTPMTYQANSANFRAAANYMVCECGHRAFVYPALAIARFDAAGFVEQLQATRDVGAPAVIIFAAAHLDNEKETILRQGPWRKPAMPPHALQQTAGNDP